MAKKNKRSEEPRLSSTAALAAETNSAQVNSPEKTARGSFTSGRETVRLLVAREGDRQALQEHFARDRDQLYAEYLQRVDNPSEPAGARTRAAELTKDRPTIRILAEGDSWFKYPLGSGLHPFQDGVIFQLQRLLGYPIANMAEPGEQVRQMLGLGVRTEIIDRLSDRRLRYDALVFSGGGNDLVGDQFVVWLKDKPPEVPPNKMLNDDAVNAALALLEAEFTELAGIRDTYSKETVIFVNCYDFPAITGIPVCNQGPWLKPSLDWIYSQVAPQDPPDPKKEFEVVKTLLERFKAMLDKVAAKQQRFVVVPTQGTLEPGSRDWQNEIHPSSEGFVKIAKKFQQVLLKQFP